MSQRQAGVPCVEGKPKEKTREVITGMGARHRRKARNKLLKSPGMKNQWRVTLGTGRAGLRTTSIYIGGRGCARGANAARGGRRG